MNNAVNFIIKWISQGMCLRLICCEKESHFSRRNHPFIDEFEPFGEFPHIMSFISIELEMGIDRFAITISRSSFYIKQKSVHILFLKKITWSPFKLKITPSITNPTWILNLIHVFFLVQTFGHIET